MYKSRTSLIALLVLAVLVTMLTGCGRKGLIKVNSGKIQKDEYYARLEQIPLQTGNGQTVNAGRAVIIQMINEQIITQLAEKEGVAPTDEQITKRIALEKKLSDLKGGQSAPLDRRVVAQKLSEFNLRTKGVTISDADMKKAYDQAIKVPNSMFARPEQIMTSVIITKNKAKIDQAYQQLRQGQDFGVVAMQTSELPNAKQSRGQLNWVGKGDRGLPPVVSNKLFATPIGQYSTPLQVPMAMNPQQKAIPMWVIVKADSKRPPKVMKYDEVKDYIRERMALAKSNQRAFVEKVLNYQKEANIVVNAERFKDIPELLKKDAANGLKMLAQQKSGGSVVPASTKP